MNSNDHANALDPTDTVPRIVRLGGMGKPALLRALHDAHVQLNAAATALFDDDRFIPSDVSRSLRIAALTVADLGFDAGATYEQLVARARDAGWAECPLELGPHLRLQFLHQPEGAASAPPTRHRAPPGSITIASPPLDGSDDTPKGFYLRRIDGDLWLRGYCSWAGHVWSPDDVMVFLETA